VIEQDRASIFWGWFTHDAPATYAYRIDHVRMR
jgi:hypothetical protein